MLHPGFCWARRGKPRHSSRLIEEDIKVAGRAAKGLETPQAEWLSPDKEEASQAAGIGLTAREEKILALVAQGMRDNQIASTLSLSPKTVRNRLSLLYRKLSINNRTQAALWALRNLSGAVKR